MSAIEGWFRPLNDERMEVFLKGGGLKIRCSGETALMYELADWFEAKTGLVVNGPDSGVWMRQRRGPRPMQGQLNLLEMTEPVEDEAVPADANTELEFTEDMEARR